MKTLNIILVLAFVCTSIFAVAQAKQTTVKVYGNCGMCKSHIEKAAKEAGATSAVWNKETKVLNLKFDASKTDSKKIQAKVAEAGYDTQDATATKEAYDKLDECCQYDRKVAAKPTSKVEGKIAAQIWQVAQKAIAQHAVIVKIALKTVAKMVVLKAVANLLVLL